ncbi:hypothetical protein BDV30DRAFT_210424 [Aspergillus minisclerotigenes]|uniref:Uncharacterized protein n=1 Tax=Aspergillus minisclerotigenes TaxID=656917 RepID=A0A5N6J4G4_9EURO|nr:hypothetical protein BDV30DRAFT_210424 [Aspergillus minisclerotigenes]
MKMVTSQDHPQPRSCESTCAGACRTVARPPGTLLVAYQGWEYVLARQRRLI